MQHKIDESQRLQLLQASKEKLELDKKVKDGELIRAKLSEEKDELSKTIDKDRIRFAEKQELERTRIGSLGGIHSPTPRRMLP